jgi:hypothetical protein
VGVDHRRFEALVPKGVLNDPDVSAALVQGVAALVNDN